MVVVVVIVVVVVVMVVVAFLAVLFPVRVVDRLGHWAESLHAIVFRTTYVRTYLHNQQLLLQN